MVRWGGSGKRNVPIRDVLKDEEKRLKDLDHTELGALWDLKLDSKDMAETIPNLPNFEDGPHKNNSD